MTWLQQLLHWILVPRDRGPKYVFGRDVCVSQSRKDEGRYAPVRVLPAKATRQRLSFYLDRWIASSYLGRRQIAIASVAVTAMLAVAGAYRLIAPRGVPVETKATEPVPDCATCHRQISQNYREVAMARSFHAVANLAAEPPDGTLDHARSGRHYEVLRSGSRLIQRRYERDAHDAAANLFELQATHAIGSANHARTYFYRTEAGDFVQLPLTSYAHENRWDMSPGFDTSSPHDFTRRAAAS